MREAERQAAQRRRLLRWEQLAVDRVAAFAVQDLARLEVALGGGDDVGMEADRAAGRFLAQADRRHRHADFQADQVPALVHDGVAAAGVGAEHVLFEAVLLVLGGRLEHDPHTLADLVGNGAAILLQRRRHLDLALVMELAALGDRPHHEGQVLDRTGRKGEAVRRRREAGGVRHGGALDGGLGAVEEGIEHLGVEPAALGLLLVEAPVFPHRLGRRLREVRQPLVAAAGGRHLEPRGPRPVDQFADQRRLVAVGEAVDHAGLCRAAGEQRAAEGVRLDRDHHDALAVPEGFQCVLDGGNRIAGRFDDDVDLGMADQGAPVVGQKGTAVLACLGERGRARDLGLPAQPRQVLPRARRRQVGDTQQMDARRRRDLRQVHRTELAGADHADAQRIRLGRAGHEHAMETHCFLPN